MKKQLLLQGKVKPSFLWDSSLQLYLPFYHTDLKSSPIVSLDQNHISCSVIGATWGNQGLDFVSTSSQYVDCGNNAALFPTAAITVEVWVKLDDVTTAQRLVSSRGTININSGYFLNVEAGVANFQIYISGGFRGSDDATMTIGVWTHLVGVYDGANIFICKNGVKGVPNTNYSGAFTESSEKLAVGRDGARNAAYTNGIIGEARVYNRALSLAENQYNYQATKWRYW